MLSWALLCWSWKQKPSEKYQKMEVFHRGGPFRAALWLCRERSGVLWVVLCGLLAFFGGVWASSGRLLGFLGGLCASPGLSWLW